MTTQKEKVDFITRFRDQFPGRDREACITAAGQLLRLAAKYQRMADEACSGPAAYVHRVPYPRAGELIEQWQAGLERRQARCEAAIRKRCAEWALPVDFGGDPRGFTVKIHFPDGTGNTWGGDADGWGVPS